MDDFDPAALPRQQLLKIVEPEAGQAVFVFDDNERDARIGQQLHQLGPCIVHARTDLFHDRRHAIAFGRAIVCQPLGLPFQVVFVISSRHTRVESDFLLGNGDRGGGQSIGDDDRACIHWVARKFAGMEPAKGRSVGNSNSAGIGA